MKEQKQSKVKGFALGMALVLAMGIAATSLAMGIKNNGWFSPDKQEEEELPNEENYDDYSAEIATFDNPIALLSMGDIQVMSATAQSESSYVSRKVTATITPSTVVDQYVTWSIAWASDAALKNEDISNYVQIAEGSQGNLTCTLNCLKAFRGSKAILTCTTRQGGKTTAVNVVYEGVPSSMSINSPSGVGSYNLGKDIVDLLYVGKTYSLNLAMDNIFHDVGSNYNDFTVTVSGVGTVQYADYVINQRGQGFNTVYGEQPTMTLDSMKDKLVSATVGNGVLKIVAKDSYFNYYESFAENASLGSPYGTYTKHYYASVKDSNGNNPYFLVTVSHKTLGFSSQYKFFIGEEVGSVSLNQSTITF